MNRHPYSELYLPGFIASPFDQNQQQQTPLVTLKHLKKNLSYLQQQYNKNVPKQPENRVKQRRKYQSVPIRQDDHKQNSELPKIFSSQEGINFKSKSYKRSISVMKEKKSENNQQEQILTVRRKGKQFRQLKSLFPLHTNKQQDLFLHKHKMMNISRALNLNKRRNRTSHRLFYEGIEHELIGKQNGPMSPSHLGVRLLC